MEGAKSTASSSHSSLFSEVSPLQIFGLNGQGTHYTNIRFILRRMEIQTLYPLHDTAIENSGPVARE